MKRLFLPALFFVATTAAAQHKLGVNVERFYGQPDDSQCVRSIVLFTEDSEGMPRIEISSTAKTLPNPEIGPRLRSNDAFSLGVMQKREVLNARESHFYSKATEKLHPDQVTDIEFVDWVPDNEKAALIKKRGQALIAKPEALVGGFYQEMDEKNATVHTYHAVRRSSLRLISGQSPDPQAPEKIILRDLPWVSQFRDFARAHVSPEKYRYVWELGRAAQVEPSQIQLNTSLAALVAARELEALGGSIDEAFIFVHAPRAANASLYSRYGFRELPTITRDGRAIEDKILVMPLKEALGKLNTRFPLQIVEDVKAAAPLDELKIFDLMDIFVEAKRQRLKVRLPGRDGGVADLVVRDFSGNVDGTLEKDLQSVGLSAEQTARLRPVMQKHSRELLVNDFTGANYQLYEPFNILEKEGAPPIPYLEVSGLEPLRNDPRAKDKVAFALLAALRAYRERLEKLGVTEIDKKLKSMMVGVYSRDADWMKLFGELNLHPIVLNRKSDPGQKGTFFSLSELMDLEKANQKTVQKLDIRHINDFRERVFRNPLNL